MDKETSMEKKPVLVVGATGYVGGRLVPRLLSAGYRVRAMGRSLEKLACRPWGHDPNVELAQGDVQDAEAMERAARGCGTAFYLVHSMTSQKKKFAESDRAGGRNMAKAAAAAGLDRIIYLSGLGDRENPDLSEHLRSRHEVEDILTEGPVPVVILRAAMILGAGSASFEMLRYLTERLPVMVTPRWVHTPCQPIAIRDILAYLMGSLVKTDLPAGTYDIGGPDVLSYREIIDIYAEVAGLFRRRIIPAPFLTPKLSAYWIHLITPVPADIAQPLAAGLAVPVVCRDNRIKDLIPLPLTPCREAIRTALERLRQNMVETCWSDAGTLIPPEWAFCGDADYTGGTLLECGYRIRIDAEPAAVWEPVIRLGGETGYYFGNSVWWLRGAMDRMMGGIGLRRGRRHPSQLQVGDALDFWRVLALEPPHQLTLLAEMKTPGEAILEIRIRDAGNGTSEFEFLSRFLPRGLFGMLYWYGLYPFHQWIFRGMQKAVARAVRRPILSGPSRFTPTIPDACTFFPDRTPPRE
jgi:uncharacterized protein YbjT (DUF2867 family)